MSYFLKVVRGTNFTNWAMVNATSIVARTPRESYRAYLAANGGTGGTLADMERNFLRTQGAVGQTLHDLWGSYSAVSGTSGGKNKEKVKNLYK